MFLFATNWPVFRACCTPVVVTVYKVVDSIYLYEVILVEDLSVNVGTFMSQLQHFLAEYFWID